MQKRMICLGLSLTMTVGMLSGCEKPGTNKINADGYPFVDDENVLSQYASDG